MAPVPFDSLTPLPSPTGSTKGSNSSSQGKPGFRAKTSTEIRRTAYRLRGGQRGLIYDLHKSVALCGLGRRGLPGNRYGDEGPGGEDGAPWATLVCQDPGEDGARADFRGLHRCASPWSCPVCAPKVAVARAAALAPQIAERMEAGYSAWLVTLTVRHDRQSGLAEMFSGLGKAWSWLTSGRAWAEVRQAGNPEYVRGYDLTDGDNGWHPHMHLTLLLPPGHGDGSGTAKWLLARWQQAVARFGFEALPEGLDAQPCRDAVAAAKYATTPAAVYESVGMSMKEARNGRAGRTPFQLLEAAVAGDAVSTARWTEYVLATKGRRQTTVSRGLTLRDDEDLLEEEKPVLAEIAALGPDTISELDRTNRATELLELVESAPTADLARQAALLVLLTLVSRQWTILRDKPPERPWASPLAPDGKLLRKMTAEDKRRLLALGKGADPGDG